MRAPVTEPGYLSLHQTAEKLGVHDNTVRNWIRSGKIVSIMKDNAYLIPEEIVERYAAAQAALKGAPEK